MFALFLKLSSTVYAPHLQSYKMDSDRRIHGMQGIFSSRAMVVLFGDSLTQRGYETNGWVGALSCYYTRRADVINRGYGGYNTRYAKYLMYSIFPTTTVEVPNPDDSHRRGLLVTVWFGANDAALEHIPAHVPIEEFALNLKEIVEYLQKQFIFVVVISPPPVHGPTRLSYQLKAYGDKASRQLERTNTRVKKYAEIARDVAARSNVLFLDLFSLMINEGDSIWPTFVGAGYENGDGLHLSEKGQMFMSKKLIELIETSTVPIDKLAVELPWGSDVDKSSYREIFDSHQKKNDPTRIGQGYNILSPTSSAINTTMHFHIVVIAIFSLTALVILTRCLWRCICASGIKSTKPFHET